MPLHVNEELLSIRDGKPCFMGFESLVPCLQKGLYIQNNNGIHALFLFRVYGNSMLSVIKSMGKYGGKYSR